MGLPDMLEHVGIVGKCPVTILTRIGSFPSVSVHVVTISQLVDKPFLANTTVEGHINLGCVLLKDVLWHLCLVDFLATVGTGQYHVNSTDVIG